MAIRCSDLEFSSVPDIGCLLSLHDPLGLEEADGGIPRWSQLRGAGWQTTHHMGWGAVEKEGQAVPVQISDSTLLTRFFHLDCFERLTTKWGVEETQSLAHCLSNSPVLTTSRPGQLGTRVHRPEGDETTRPSWS